MAQSQNKIRDAFHHQRANAKTRQIVFNLTYEQWCQWWLEQLGYNWFKERGCRKGQYVMARFNDVGPYELGNIKCILQAENGSERAPTTGTKHGMCKLTEEQALQIKKSKHNRADLLATKFNVSRRTILDIQEGRRWKHLPSN